MRIPTSTFLVFMCLMTSGLIWAYSFFVGYFSKDPELQFKVTHLEEKLQHEQFERNLLAYQLKDFQQSVAQALPLQKGKAPTLAFNNLKAIVREPSSLPPLDLSSKIYENVKSSFKNKKYQEVIEKSEEMIKNFPTSIHVVEAYFLTAESYFLLSNYKKSLEVMDLMIEHFPDHDLTGFILLRMGQISELNNQLEEAKEIYNTVQSQFANSTLKKQAIEMAKRIQ